MARSYYKDASGGVGSADARASGRATSASSTHTGVLTDADGKKLTRAPDYASYFTNAYLPRTELMRARVLAVRAAAR